MAQPSEMDWVPFKSCDECRFALLCEAGIDPEVVRAFGLNKRKAVKVSFGRQPRSEAFP